MSNLIPNIYKHEASDISNCIRKDDHALGVNLVEYGSTVDTDFWNGYEVPTNGYVIYNYKASNGPSIIVATSDAHLIIVLNQLGISGSNIGECLNNVMSDNNIMVANFNYENIVTDGLILNIDASFVSSYPREDTVWYDMTYNDNDVTLYNGPTYDAGSGANEGSLYFDGTDDKAETSALVLLNDECTVNIWFKIGIDTGINRIIRAIGTGTNIYYMTLYPSSDTLTFTRGTNTNITVNYSFSSSDWLNVNWYWDDSSEFESIIINDGSPTEGSYTKVSGGGDGILGISSDGSNMYTGYVSIVKIYNRALTSAEVTQNFEAHRDRYGI